MAANGISTLGTKALKQVAKLDIAQAKRQGKTVATDGTISGAVDSTKPYYRAKNTYDLAFLPTQYDGIDIVDNANTSGLSQGRPWYDPNTEATYNGEVIEVSPGIWRTNYEGYHYESANFFDTAALKAAPNNFDAADNDINALKNNGSIPEGYTVNNYLTDTNAWFLCTDVPNGLKHFIRSPLENKMDGDFDTGNVRYKARERYSFGVSDPRGIFASPGA